MYYTDHSVLTTIRSYVHVYTLQCQCLYFNVFSCLIYSRIAAFTMHAHTLYIDLVATVKNIIVNSNATSFTISWTAPFSLDVTGVDPDIWYSVLIYNVTDEPTAVPCTDCMDITETHYTFTPDYPSPCQEYIFTVIPLNGAGQGPPSDTTSYSKELVLSIKGFNLCFPLHVFYV